MIKIENLNKAFGKNTLFKDLSIAFEEGCLIGLFGPSGSGKSTLLNMISMLEPVDSGTISYKGGKYSGLKRSKAEKYRVAHFSYVFPEAQLLPCLNAMENIVFPLNLQKLPIDEQKIQEVCHRLQLDSLLESDVTLLSSGEKQRVALARALILPQPVMIADEPTSHLDPELSREIISLLKETASSEKRIILCSCHDSELFDLFDSAYTLKDAGLVPYEKKR